MRTSDLEQRILYRDANLIVIDKPSGLAVHAGPRTTLHVEGLAAGLAPLRGQAPQPAHRLDRDTAGCLVLARHDKARSRLGRLFGGGQVAKTYWAVVRGCPAARQGTIRLALKKVSSREQGWRMVPVADAADGGQPAETDWRLLGSGDGLAWLELKPRTGRTHQIRVHCADGLGLPILGDPLYGPPPAGGPPAPPLHLLARALELPYWADRPPIAVVAAPPPHMLAALRRCGFADAARA